MQKLMPGSRHALRDLGRGLANAAAIASLALWSAALSAAGYHTYLDEGNALVNRLLVVLIEEHVCTSIVDCQTRGGHAFIKPVKYGIEISVYGVNSDRVAAKLLQECATSFATKQLGQEMSVAIYRITNAERNSQRLINRTPPKFVLRLEKNDGHN